MATSSTSTGPLPTIGRRAAPDPSVARYEPGPGLRAYLLEVIEIDGTWHALYATRDGARAICAPADADRLHGDGGLRHALACRRHALEAVPEPAQDALAERVATLHGALEVRG